MDGCAASNTSTTCHITQPWLEVSSNLGNAESLIRKWRGAELSVLLIPWSCWVTEGQGSPIFGDGSLKEKILWGHDQKLRKFTSSAAGQSKRRMQCSLMLCQSSMTTGLAFGKRKQGRNSAHAAVKLSGDTTMSLFNLLTQLRSVQSESQSEVQN